MQHHPSGGRKAPLPTLGDVAFFPLLLTGAAWPLLWVVVHCPSSKNWRTLKNEKKNMEQKRKGQPQAREGRADPNPEKEGPTPTPRRKGQPQPRSSTT